ncbi:hypothetical protein [Caulobacter sp. S45]|jgi:hypothetical protein|uniref:hypothetical protein n=1 Tax=Caulobacter sp. S45 TaxID=1641861 RepID=UPI00131E11A6|nr:hypothetical protein [Caulobacter sp. S45]
MKRSEAVLEAAHFLHTAEYAIDGAYGETAALATNLVKLRAAAGLSATVGQPALDAVTAAMNSLNAARAQILQAHGELAEVKTRMGCRTVATGGGDKDDTDAIAAPQPLALVAVAA